MIAAMPLLIVNKIVNRSPWVAPTAIPRRVTCLQFCLQSLLAAWRRIFSFLDILTIRGSMSISQSSLDYMLSFMTMHYQSMLLGGSRFTIFDSYWFLDFCLDFFARSGVIVFYDDSSMKYKIDK